MWQFEMHPISLDLSKNRMFSICGSSIFSSLVVAQMLSNFLD